MEEDFKLLDIKEFNKDIMDRYIELIDDIIWGLNDCMEESEDNIVKILLTKSELKFIISIIEKYKEGVENNGK